MVSGGTQKLYIETFGCQMNKLDSELVLGELRLEGYEPTDTRDEADLVLFNTCSVRDQAENRVHSHLGELKRIKRSRPGLILGVTGCMAQRDSEALLARHLHVDLVVGTAQIQNIRALVREVAQTGRRIAAVELDQVQFHRDVATRPNRHQAFVSVMRGCDVMCTFCVVPFTRGREQSATPAEIADEVRRLADDGVREVTFLGQTVNSYGKRLAARSSLARLIEDAAQVSGIARVRFITSHPNFMTDDLVDVLAHEPKACPYLHLPAQHGSNAVLERMRRGYTVEHYREVAHRLRARVGSLALASDFIVGFPGETADDHAATEALMREVGFANSFVFRYSVRPQTYAARKLPDDVPEPTKRERNQRLLAIQEEVSLARNRGRLGARALVLVEGPSKRDESRLFGRTPEHEIVVFDGPPSLAGEIVPVDLVDCTALTLFGRRVAAERADPAPVAAAADGDRRA